MICLVDHHRVEWKQINTMTSNNFYFKLSWLNDTSLIILNQIIMTRKSWQLINKVHRVLVQPSLEDLIKDRLGSFDSIDDTGNKQNGHNPRELIMSWSELVN